MRRTTGRSASVLAVLGALVAAACDSGDTGEAGDTGAASSAPAAATAPTTGPPSTSETTTAVTVAATSGSPPTTEQATTEPPTTPASTVAAAAWEEVLPGGECRCATGDEFRFWVRRGDPQRVLLFLQGGGACFSAETCDPAAGTYRTTAGTADAHTAGIFDIDDPQNPLADHSVVYVPYCTGDVHLGTRTTTYGGVEVHHVGSINAAAALDHLVATFPDATEVVVAGESAGSIPTPLYAGLVTDRLPDADVTAIADGSGAYGDIPGINALLDSTWGVLAGLPAWDETAAWTPETWSIPGLFVAAGRHAPDVTFARHDYAFDRTQAFFGALAGGDPGDLVGLIDANEVQIEAGGVDLLSYVAPGDLHTVLGSDRFYDQVVDGTPLVDWVTGLLAGAPVDDVHCVDCGG